MIGVAVAEKGPYIVYWFWMVLGVYQWVYLYPAIRWSRSREWPGVVLGIWIAAGVTLALTVLQLVVRVVPQVVEQVTGNSRPNVTYAGTDSRVVSTDATHIVVRAGLGDAAHPSSPGTRSFLVNGATKFDFRGPAWRQQSRPAGMDWLTPGRRVKIDYVRRNRRRVAVFVAIWVEQPEP